MSKAYQCDGCGEYHDGTPERKLYEHIKFCDKYMIESELCDYCSEKFGDNFTTDSNE